MNIVYFCKKKSQIILHGLNSIANHGAKHVNVNVIGKTNKEEFDRFLPTSVPQTFFKDCKKEIIV